MTTTTLGLVVALSAEARALCGRKTPAQRIMRLEENVLLWVGGMGGAAAGRGCDALIRAGANALSSVGTAAGLAPDCEAGAVVLPRRIRGAGGETFTVDPDWHAALAAALGAEFRLHTGTLVAVDAVVGVDEKRALHDRTGAVAADMESGAVARAAQAAGLPLMVLRVVSDGPRDALPPGLTGAVDAFGRIRHGALLAALFSNPVGAVNVWRLRQGFKTACATLAKVARVAGPEFSCL